LKKKLKRKKFKKEIKKIMILKNLKQIYLKNFKNINFKYTYKGIASLGKTINLLLIGKTLNKLDIFCILKFPLKTYVQFGVLKRKT
jgi:hypothetical protein